MKAELDLAFTISAQSCLYYKPSYIRYSIFCLPNPNKSKRYLKILTLKISKFQLFKQGKKKKKHHL